MFLEIILRLGKDRTFSKETLLKLGKNSERIYGMGQDSSFPPFWAGVAKKMGLPVL